MGFTQAGVVETTIVLVDTEPEVEATVIVVLATAVEEDVGDVLETAVEVGIELVVVETPNPQLWLIIYPCSETDAPVAFNPVHISACPAVELDCTYTPTQLEYCRQVVRH